MFYSFRQIGEVYIRFCLSALCMVPFGCSGVSTSFLLSSWIEPDQVIGLCGQDEPGRGPLMRTVARYDGEA
ncbi:hypothetical protein EV1_019429 [Malus domestica]